MLKASVIGPKGYTGIELVKILLNHPDVNLAFLVSRDREFSPIQKYIPEIAKEIDKLVGAYDLNLVAKESDVVFLALPHRESMHFVSKLIDKDVVIIDLSADFRFQDVGVYEKWYQVEHVAKDLLRKAVYGLSEWQEEQLTTANLIACPGCYPTSVLLAALPLLANDLVEAKFISDSKSGISGAGKNPSPANHFGESYSNFRAYKINAHQHTPEMEEKCKAFSGKDASVTFVPHLLPIFRGILSTLYFHVKSGVTAKAIGQAFSEAYANKKFVRFLGENVSPQISHVVGTNFCDIGFTFHEDKNQLVVISAIDNLLKGASGQAVQNMNIRFGLKQEAGFYHAS